MSIKLGLNIGGKRFDVDVADDFALFLQEQFKKDFSIDTNNDVKILLQAYVRKNYELFAQEQKIAEITKKLELS